MTPADLKAWRQSLGFNKAQATRALGCGRHSIHLWEQGRGTPPLYIALACAAVSLGIAPYGEPPVIQPGGPHDGRAPSTSDADGFSTK